MDLPLVLLPGLGADARVFDPLRAKVPDLFTPGWIPALPGEPFNAIIEAAQTTEQELLAVIMQRRAPRG